MMQSVAAANAECAGIHKMFKAHQNFAQNIRDASKTQAEKARDWMGVPLFTCTERRAVQGGREVPQQAAKRVRARLHCTCSHRGRIFDVKMQILGHAVTDSAAGVTMM